jgi:hypothetical protein
LSYLRYDKPRIIFRLNRIDPNEITREQLIVQIFIDIVLIFMILVECMLNNTLFFQSPQLVQVKAERSKCHFHMSSNNRSHVGMSVVENILDDRVGSLTGRSYS